jgi:hypothetical protein
MTNKLKKVGPCKGPPKKKDSTLKSNHNMKLTFQLPKLPNGDVNEIRIHVSNTYWMGKVQPGDYFLDTPDRYASSQMMPLPAVRRLINQGELPHINFRKETYVLRSLPVLRVVQPIDDSFEPFL